MDSDPIHGPAALVRRPGRAFTLVEVLLALAIAGLVAATVGSMLMAVASGTSSNHDLRGVATKGRIIDARLSAAIRTSRSIVETAAGPDYEYVALWVADANTNATTDQSEVRLIEFDSGNEQISNYYDESASGAFVDANMLRGAVTAEVWATGVTAATFVPDAAVPSTKLISYRLTLRAGKLSDTVVGAAATRYSGLN